MQYHIIRKVVCADTTMVALLSATCVPAPVCCPCEPGTVLADQVPCPNSRQLEEWGWLCLGQLAALLPLSRMNASAATLASL